MTILSGHGLVVIYQLPVVNDLVPVRKFVVLGPKRRFVVDLRVRPADEPLLAQFTVDSDV